MTARWQAYDIWICVVWAMLEKDFFGSP